MTSGLCNLEYYKGTFLEIRKFMEMREEGMEVQEETVFFTPSFQTQILPQYFQPNSRVLLPATHI